MRLTTTILMATLTISGTAVAGNNDAAVLKVHDELSASWNKNDYKAIAALFADDADLINPLGRVAKGRAEIEKLYMEEQTGAFKGSHFTSDCKSAVRFVKPDVAIVTCAFEVTGGKLPDGSAMPPLKGIYTATMVKKKTRWQIVVGRPMVPLTPPPSKK